MFLLARFAVSGYILFLLLCRDVELLGIVGSPTCRRVDMKISRWLSDYEEPLTSISISTSVLILVFTSNLRFEFTFDSTYEVRAGTVL